MIRFKNNEMTNASAILLYQTFMSKFNLDVLVS